ncbi:MAG: HAMP domain-containing histidine kinase [Oscillospiraceae bacterium]|jgi:signal transduction histidine kinase|nr:HAMP domain-containing histidine kinase [Oscillospiraceae bacterium]
MLKAATEHKKQKKASSRLYVKYFIVITSMLLICITVAGSLIMVFISNSTKRDRLELLSKAVSQIDESAEEQFEKYHDSNWDPEVGNTVAKAICNELKTYSFALNSDFFLANAKDGTIIYCKEMITHGDTSPQSCPAHKDMVISPDALYRANDPLRAAYIGNLDGIYEDRHFIAGSPVVYTVDNAGESGPGDEQSRTTIAYVFATQSVDVGLLSYISRVFKILLFSSLLALFLSLITVYFLTYSMTRPLREMLAATKRYAKGDFSYRIPVRGNDELADLTLAFNNMANSLALLESSRRSFVANVSHELKTPMTTIAGFIDGMLDGTISGPEQKSKYLRIVSDEVKRLSRLITSMLNMSKIEAGELKINRKHYNITEQIINTLLNFEKMIEEKNIQILGLDEIQPVSVNADKDMVNQVVYNLVDNAVKFTPPGGSIAFKVYTEMNDAVVKIKNSGVGIPIDDLKKVFERFYKVDKSRSMDTKSVGLGLYIVKSIIELHDGKITVDSSGNNFVEFSFWLPVI